MTALLTTIAFLCGMPINGPSVSWKESSKDVLECQQYYVNCLEKSIVTKDLILLNCIKDRKIK